MAQLLDILNRSPKLRAEYVTRRNSSVLPAVDQKRRARAILALEASREQARQFLDEIQTETDSEKQKQLRIDFTKKATDLACGFSSLDNDSFANLCRTLGANERLAGDVGLWSNRAGVALSIVGIVPHPLVSVSAGVLGIANGVGSEFYTSWLRDEPTVDNALELFLVEASRRHLSLSEQYVAQAGSPENARAVRDMTTGSFDSREAQQNTGLDLTAVNQNDLTQNPKVTELLELLLSTQTTNAEETDAAFGKLFGELKTQGKKHGRQLSEITRAIKSRQIDEQQAAQRRRDAAALRDDIKAGIYLGQLLIGEVLGKPDLARDFGNIANATLELSSAIEAAEAASGALGSVSVVGAAVTLGIAIYGLFSDSDRPNPDQIIIDQILMLRQELQDFRREVVENLTIIKRQNQAILEALDEVIDQLNDIRNILDVRLQRLEDSIRDLIRIENLNAANAIITDYERVRTEANLTLQMISSTGTQGGIAAQQQTLIKAQATYFVHTTRSSRENALSSYPGTARMSLSSTAQEIRHRGDLEVLMGLLPSVRAVLGLPFPADIRSVPNPREWYRGATHLIELWASLANQSQLLDTQLLVRCHREATRTRDTIRGVVTQENLRRACEQYRLALQNWVDRLGIWVDTELKDGAISDAAALVAPVLDARGPSGGLSLPRLMQWLGEHNLIMISGARYRLWYIENEVLGSGMTRECAVRSRRVTDEFVAWQVNFNLPDWNNIVFGSASADVGMVDTRPGFCPNMEDVLSDPVTFRTQVSDPMIGWAEERRQPLSLIDANLNARVFSSISIGNTTKISVPYPDSIDQVTEVTVSDQPGVVRLFLRYLDDIHAQKRAAVLSPAAFQEIELWPETSQLNDYAAIAQYVAEQCAYRLGEIPQSQGPRTLPRTEDLLDHLDQLLAPGTGQSLQARFASRRAEINADLINRSPDEAADTLARFDEIVAIRDETDYQNELSSQASEFLLGFVGETAIDDLRYIKLTSELRIDPNTTVANFIRESLPRRIGRMREVTRGILDNPNFDQHPGSFGFVDAAVAEIEGIASQLGISLA